MTRAGLLAGLAAFGAVVGAAKAATFHVAGSFFRYAPGEGAPPPIAGAAVFIQAEADSSKWVGPSLTDESGRFTFIDVPAGNYLLRAFLASNFLWQQNFVASDSPLRAVVVAVHDPRTLVVCYEESADALKVKELVKNLGYRNRLFRRGTQNATNIVRFGSRVALEEVKLFASSLIAGGISLRAIRRFSSDSDFNRDVIESGTDPSIDDPSLTIGAIQSTNDFARGSPGEHALTLTRYDLATIARNLKGIPTEPSAPSK